MARTIEDFYGFIFIVKGHKYERLKQYFRLSYKSGNENIYHNSLNAKVLT